MPPSPPNPGPEPCLGDLSDIPIALEGGSDVTLRRGHCSTERVWFAGDHTATGSVTDPTDPALARRLPRSTLALWSPLSLQTCSQLRSAPSWGSRGFPGAGREGQAGRDATQPAGTAGTSSNAVHLLREARALGSCFIEHLLCAEQRHFLASKVLSSPYQHPVLERRTRFHPPTM